MKLYSGVSAPSVFPLRPPLSPTAFPHDGPPAAQLEFVLKYAILAPSGHNTQPWRFRICHDQVELFGDFSRAMPVIDPQNRELAMSCGAALLNLRVAIRNFGLTAMTELCPDPDRPELLAVLRLNGEAPSGRTDHKLFKAITDRRTARVPFDGRQIPRALLYRWQRAAAYEEGEIYLVEDPAERRAIADLIAVGDQLLGSRDEYRSELALWVRSNDYVGRDGLPGYSMGFGGLSSRIAPQAHFPYGAIQARRDSELVAAAPAFAVLCTAEDNLESWLLAGQALGRVLLAAQAEGVSASFFLQPIEVPELREKLMSILPAETGWPQITFRLGYGPKVPPTPRRPLSEVVEKDH